MGKNAMPDDAVMVEVMARAMWLTVWDGEVLLWEDAGRDNQEMALSKAHAIITALRPQFAAIRRHALEECHDDAPWTMTEPANWFERGYLYAVRDYQKRIRAMINQPETRAKESE